MIKRIIREIKNAAYKKRGFYLVNPSLSCLLERRPLP